MKLFHLESSFMNFVYRFANLIYLNLLWLVCCLPVITAGASTTALYSCLLSQDEDGASSVFRSFFAAFKANFRKSTFLWILQAAALFVAGFDLWYFFASLEQGSLLSALQPFSLIPAVWILLSCSYLFPLQAQFENSVGNTLKNAALISIAHLPTSVIVTVLNLLPVLIFLFDAVLFLKTSVIWALIGVALLAWVNARLLKKVFLKYMPEN